MRLQGFFFVLSGAALLAPAVASCGGVSTATGRLDASTSGAGASSSGVGTGSIEAGPGSVEGSAPHDAAASDGKACPVACAFGCSSGPSTCYDLVPANQAAASLASGDVFTCTGHPSTGAPDVTVPPGGTVTFDTHARTITVAGVGLVPAQWGNPYTPDGSGTSVVVAHVRSLTLGAGATMRVSSTSGPAIPGLVLLVDQDFRAPDGTSAMVDLSAKGGVTPGAGAPSTTASGAGSDPPDAGGGTGGFGGGGHGWAGGAGGCDGTTAIGGAAAAGGAGGAPYGVAPGTEILEAGQGPGGGALQISACGTIVIGSGVIVNASGGGGGGGAAGVTRIVNVPGLGGGGGGGGSGGTILLEASSIAALGELVANGGGGGSGGSPGAPGGPGARGENWDPATDPSAPALGGLGNVSLPGAQGGAGGAGNSPAGQAGMCGEGSGGGGGAAGAIFLNVPATAPAPTVGRASPPPKLSHTCTTAALVCTYP